MKLYNDLATHFLPTPLSKLPQEKHKIMQHVERLLNQVSLIVLIINQINIFKCELCVMKTMIIAPFKTGSNQFVEDIQLCVDGIISSISKSLTALAYTSIHG